MFRKIKLSQMQFELLLIPFIISLSLCSAVFADNDAVILTYHHVADNTPPSTSISPKDFRSHLRYLQDNDFNVMPLPDIITALQNGEILPDKAIALTFDDGYLSIFETAFPMLKEFGFPFTLFVSTQPIDDQQANYMNWDQIRELSAAGVTVANHMVNHPYMLNKPADVNEQIWIKQLEQEMLQAQARIQQETQQNHFYLAYPYGEFDGAIKAMVSKNGFVGFAQNSGAISTDSDFLALPRFPLGGIYANLETAKVKMYSRAFSVALESPNSPVIDSTQAIAKLRFNSGNYLPGQINCFNNNQVMTMHWLDQQQGLLELKADQPAGARRWRYICTAPEQRTENDAPKRYYWYSVPWIQLAN